jgi:hypothetical protein
MRSGTIAAGVVAARTRRSKVTASGAVVGGAVGGGLFRAGVRLVDFGRVRRVGLTGVGRRLRRGAGVGWRRRNGAAVLVLGDVGIGLGDRTVEVGRSVPAAAEQSQHRLIAQRAVRVTGAEGRCRRLGRSRSHRAKRCGALSSIGHLTGCEHRLTPTRADTRV